MDRELQSKFVDSIIQTSRKTNGIIDVVAFLDCLRDKPKDAKFFMDHGTKTLIPGDFFSFTFSPFESKRQKLSLQ